MSSYEEYIQQGLGGEAPLKVILCGNVEEAEKDKIGVVSVVYATEKKEWAEQKIRELTKAHHGWGDLQKNLPKAFHNFS